MLINLSEFGVEALLKELVTMRKNGVCMVS